MPGASECAADDSGGRDDSEMTEMDRAVQVMIALTLIQCAMIVMNIGILVIIVKIYTELVKHKFLTEK